MRIQMALAWNANYFTAWQLKLHNESGEGETVGDEMRGTQDENKDTLPLGIVAVKLQAIKWSKLINFALCAIRNSI